jgi:hypothetical protein
VRVTLPPTEETDVSSGGNEFEGEGLSSKFEEASGLIKGVVMVLPVTNSMMPILLSTGDIGLGVGMREDDVATTWETKGAS